MEYGKMDSESMSVEDELFLFETFLKISSPDYNDEPEVFFSDDETDVPLSEYFMYEREPSQCPSPVETIPSPTSPQQFFPASFPIKRCPSPCDSPTPLFPPIRLENLLPPCTPSPAAMSTPPPTPLSPETPNFATPAYNLYPEYIPEPSYPPVASDADSATVHFIDLKDLYEKAQVRRRGTSEQRLVDCRIHMVANFLTIPRDVQVWVRRNVEVKGCQSMVQLPVNIDKTMLNMQYFSVNLDAVYVTAMGKKFYQLSTTDRFRKNRFTIHVNLTFEDNSIAEFKSGPFLIRSRKQSPNPRKPRLFSA